jgi:hypothetical protein
MWSGPCAAISRVCGDRTGPRMSSIPFRTGATCTGPGTGVAPVTEIHAFAAARRALLAGLDHDGLNRPVTCPWDTPKTLAHSASWLNIELTKNIAELGQLRLLRAAT